MAGPAVKSPHPAVKASHPSPSASPHGESREHTLRLQDILQLLVTDGLVNSAEATQLDRARATRIAHPLELVADQKWKSLVPPHPMLTLETLVEWLAGKLGVRYMHIDPLK